MYTSGRRKTEDTLLRDLNMDEIIPCERGGLVTYHCPGQIVVYPLLNLNFYKKCVRWYIQSLEGVFITYYHHYFRYLLREYHFI